MARKFLMTWVAVQRRWVKKNHGKMYAVSCRQLNCPETKEASAAAANAWWEAKLAEIKSAPLSEEERRAEALQVQSLVQGWAGLAKSDRERLVDAIVGGGQYKIIRAQAEAMVESASGPAPADRTVVAQVEVWERLLRASCRAGRLSEGRYDAYRRRVATFAAWMGPASAVDAIDEVRLEGYYSHLSGLVAEGRYAPATAHESMMTAKQFVSRLASLKLIPLPGNIRDRRFRFGHSVASKIETFSIDEVRALLAACVGRHERTRLFILLMLNCGMYQNDIAELRHEEVDWEAGTIERARSKTRARGGPVVIYKLWPETLALLVEYRSAGDPVLTTSEGNPLVKEWLEDEKYRKYDAIRSAWHRLALKMGKEKPRLGLKHLRKTAATLLGEHPQYKYFAGHFLADSPKGMDQKHYVRPNEAEFFEALIWLRDRILGE